MSRRVVVSTIKRVGTIEGAEVWRLEQQGRSVYGTNRRWLVLVRAKMAGSVNGKRVKFVEVRR